MKTLRILFVLLLTLTSLTAFAAGDGSSNTHQGNWKVGGSGAYSFGDGSDILL